MMWELVGILLESVGSQLNWFCQWGGQFLTRPKAMPVRSRGLNILLLLLVVADECGVSYERVIHGMETINLGLLTKESKGAKTGCQNEGGNIVQLTQWKCETVCAHDAKRGCTIWIW